MVSSFDVPLLAAMRQRLPDLPRALIAGRLPRFRTSRARGLGCVALHLHHEAVTPARASRIKGRGLGISVWSVDDPARASALWDIGVDCIISGAPDRIAAAWRRRLGTAPR
jgi:glycerophosphoryl diester phosphodiesterase